MCLSRPKTYLYHVLVSSKDIQEFFERVASDWDQMRLAYYDESVIEKMAEASNVDGDSVVADVGTGTGFVAAGLAPRVKKVVGFDNSQAMLDVARENLATLGVDNVDLVEADVLRLPLADSDVDAAFANMVLHHAHEPTLMLAEMARVVKPGGTVAITDEVQHHYEWMHTEHADVWLGFTEEQVEWFFAEAGLQSYGYEPLGMA
ncbi:hypothetical protein BH23ACT11_BH23ACT11_18120 [soil metagenome]